MTRARWRIAALLVLGVAASCAGPTVESYRSPEERALMSAATGHMTRAKAAFEQKDYEAVIRECSAGLELPRKPTDDLVSIEWDDWHALRGQAYEAMGDSDKATADYQEAIHQVRPSYRTARLPDYEKRIAAAKRPAQDAEVNAAEKRVREHPDSADALALRARALYRRGQPGDLDRALTDARAGVALDAASPCPLWILGDLLFDRGDAYADAQAAYLKAEEFFPNGHAAGLFRLGLMADKEGDHDLAMERYTQAGDAEEAFDPDLQLRWPNPELLGAERRAECSALVGRGLMRRAISAKSAKTEEEIDKALKAFDTALDIDPGNVEALFGQMKGRFLIGQHGRALDSARRLRAAPPLYLKVRENDGDFWMEVSWIEALSAHATQDWQRCADRTEALTSTSGDADAWLLRAIAWEHLGDLPAAARYLEKALSIDPNLSTAEVPETVGYLQQRGVRVQEDDAARAALVAERNREPARVPFQSAVNAHVKGFGSANSDYQDNLRIQSYLEAKINAERRHEEYYGTRPTGW